MPHAWHCRLQGTILLLLARKWQQQAPVWLACCSGRQRLPCLCPHEHDNDNSSQLDFTSWLHVETPLDSASTPRPSNNAALDFNVCKNLCLHGYTCRWMMRTPQPAGKARSSYELRPAQIASTREAPAPELQYRALSACCRAAEKAGTTFGLLCFDVLKTCHHTKGSLPRVWLNA